MKSFFIFTAAVVLIMTSAFSCDTKKNTADYVIAENFKVYTDTTYPEIPINDIDAENQEKSKKKLAYALNGSHVELLLDNVPVRILDFYYTPSAENIAVADYNGDGYEDIFIPYESPPDYGTYYCYDKEKNNFFENDQLNKVGRIMTVNEDGILCEDRSDDLTKRYVEYQWIGAELKPIKKTETFKSSETGEIITNIYGYDENGNEFLAG